MDPVDMTPIATCGLEQPIDPETLDKVNQRIAVVSDKVDMLVLDYQASNSGDTAKDMLRNCTSLVASFAEQTADPHEAMQLACEALAVAVQKLAFASWQEEMFAAEQKKVHPTGDNSGGNY
jgi:DNA-binding PucR family transcriptional regulator